MSKRQTRMLNYYPFALELKGRKVSVIGGGKVAERKIKNLLKTHARLKVISPYLTAGLRRFVSKKKIYWVGRYMKDADIYSTDIVIAATDDPKVNRKISKLAKKRNILANIVDKPSLSGFIFPAMFRVGGAIIAVYTDGEDPPLSRDLKNYLKENWDAFISYRNRPQKNSY